MKRIICINSFIFWVLVNAVIASENNLTNTQNVKREIEFNAIISGSEEARIIDAAAIDNLGRGIAAIGTSECSIDLKFMKNGLKSRMPWAISSKQYNILMLRSQLMKPFLCVCVMFSTTSDIMTD